MHNSEIVIVVIVVLMIIVTIVIVVIVILVILVIVAMLIKQDGLRQGPVHCVLLHTRAFNALQRFKRGSEHGACNSVITSSDLKHDVAGVAWPNMFMQHGASMHTSAHEPLGSRVHAEHLLP